MEEARLEMEKRNREVRGRRGKLEGDLAEAIRRSDRLIDQVADGVLSGAAIKDKLAHSRPSARRWRQNWRLRKPPRRCPCIR